jgi:hypothetical protein
MPDRMFFRNRVERITQLQSNPDGTVRPTVLHVGKERGSRNPRRDRNDTPAEWTVRNLAESTANASQEYLKRHNRSNGKVRGGWLIDFPANVWFAYRRAKRTFGW